MKIRAKSKKKGVSVVLYYDTLEEAIEKNKLTLTDFEPFV